MTILSKGPNISRTFTRSNLKEFKPDPRGELYLLNEQNAI